MAGLFCLLFCTLYSESPVSVHSSLSRCLLPPSHIPGPGLEYKKAHRLKSGFHPGAPRVSARGTGMNQIRIHADGGRLSPK